MITPNHGLSGFVCAQVAMPLLRRRSPLSERAMGLAVFLGAMLPDGDIVTRLLLGRGAYFSGAWYGHRGLSHSIAGTLLLALLTAALLTAVQRLRPPAAGAAPPPAPPRAAFAWLAGCLWAGGLLHIFGDLFTPGWQMPVFWPLADVLALPPRLGGWRHIGWFSPYLLWLFVATVALGWALRRGLPRLGPWLPQRATLLRRLAGQGALLAWALYAVAALRWVSFLVTSRYESRSQWTAYHESLLPEALVGPLTAAISTIWHWFTG